MPKTCKYDANATPPQFTDHEGLTIESGSHVRVKIAGIRNEVGEIRAIGSINEDYLGYDLAHACFAFGSLLITITDLCKTKTLQTQHLEKICGYAQKSQNWARSPTLMCVAAAMGEVCLQMS